MSLPRQIQVHDVTLRDGLQSIAQVVPTKDKLELLDAMYGAGIRSIEAGSFVNPKLVPAMADTAEVVRHARRYPDLNVSAVIPNLKGARLAFEAGVSEIVMPISASRLHSKANVNKSPEEMVDTIFAIHELRLEMASPAKILIGLTTAFGCTLQGSVEPDLVCQIASRAIEAGADACSVGDTVGYASPDQVDQLIGRLQAVIGERLIGAHLHNTRGLGLANALVALKRGLGRHDASLAGLGGCPYAPGASGNIVIEDLVFMLDSMHYATSIDIASLLKLRELLARILPEEKLFGFVAQAGLPRWSDGNGSNQGGRLQ